MPIKQIPRNSFLKQIVQGFRMHDIVALIGPRQCGKTTLANEFINKQCLQGYEAKLFDLEDPNHLAQLANPKLALADLKDFIVIDEIQYKTDLFPLLRVLVDRPDSTQKYLILGSASRDLISKSSETLAGRIYFLELTPFNLLETNSLKRHWLYGGFPKSYLAPTIEDSLSWRVNYIRTFLERDIPNLGINIPAESLRKFWNMLAHYHGNILNSSELGRSLAISHTTVKRYLDILVGTFMIRELKPWYENISKRQVKQSKVYLTDSGILHYLLGISDNNTLQAHPKLGASWEGFALEQTIRSLPVDSEDCYFWATHQGAELDLLITKFGKKIGYEFKYSDAPSMTKSIYNVLESLKLDSLNIIYPGQESYRIHEIVNVSSLQNIISCNPHN